MLLLLILATLCDHASKIPYQQKLAAAENYCERDNSDYLSRMYSVVAKGVGSGSQNREADNHQPESPNYPQQQYALWIGIAAVGINTIYVIVAVLQWRAIKYQVRMSQRAQLAASPKGVFDLFDGPTPRVVIALKNIGGTAAYDCRYESWIELLPFPFIDFSTRADYAKNGEPCALYPHHKSLTINIPVRPGLTDMERQDILHCRTYLCLRVHVLQRCLSLAQAICKFRLFRAGEGIGISAQVQQFQRAV